MADLVTKITETLTLNGVQQGGTTTKTYTGINDVYKWIVEVPSTEITLYTTNATAVGGSQFEQDLIEYVRISNLDSSNAVSLIIDAGDEVAYKLPGGDSLLLSNHLTAIEGVASASNITVTDGIAAIYRYTVSDGDAANGMTEKQSITIVDSKSLSKKYVVCDGNTITDGTATGTVLTSTSDTGAGTAGSSYAGGIALVLPNISSSTQNDFLVQLKAAVEHANGHNGSLTVSSVPGAADGAQVIDITSAYKGDSGNNLPTEDIANLAVAQQTAGVDGSIAGLSTIVGISAIAQSSTSAGAKVEIFIASK